MLIKFSELTVTAFFNIYDEITQIFGRTKEHDDWNISFYSYISIFVMQKATTKPSNLFRPTDCWHYFVMPSWLDNTNWQRMKKVRGNGKGLVQLCFKSWLIASSASWRMTFSERFLTKQSFAMCWSKNPSASRRGHEKKLTKDRSRLDTRNILVQPESGRQLEQYSGRSRECSLSTASRMPTTAHVINVLITEADQLYK